MFLRRSAWGLSTAQRRSMTHSLLLILRVLELYSMNAMKNTGLAGASVAMVQGKMPSG